MLRYKPHTLSEKEERLLALQMESAQTPREAFGQLTNADMTFGLIEMPGGETLELTHGTYSRCLENPDRNVREVAFHQYYAEFSDHANTLAATLGGSVKQDVYQARVRNHASARAAALFPDNVPETVYDNLITAVRANLPAVHKYYAVRRRAMAKIGQAAEAVAEPGTRIVAVQPSFGATSIEDHHDDVWAAAGVAEQVREGEAAGADAYVIACFGDPGLHAARELARGPVIGIAEAAFHMATLLATGFSVVTTLTRTCVIAEHLVLQYGFERRCRGIHGTDIAVLELDDPKSQAFERILASARHALEHDRSGAIVLGCAGMADLCTQLQQRLGVPVIDGVAAAVKLAEGLVRLKLGTSKLGDYAAPIPKRYVGLAEPYSPA